MAENEVIDPLALPEITLALASDTYRNELTAADTIDLKAVGLATADVAALTILISFHKSVSEWWISAALLAASGFCLFLVLRQRFWELGIEPKDFWDENEGKPREAILESAIAGIERNRTTNEPFLLSKALWFRWGYRSLAAGLATLLGTTLWHAYR
jgi:hypothetical protein